MLLTAGEQISIALLSMAINDLGREAVSFTGLQAGIVTDTAHGRARIVAMRSERVREALDAGRVAIVAGFQGVSTTLDVTTLGRGGSDTTAVALAAALDADVCEIYTDVDGVFTADPRIVPEARKLDTVTYEEMLDLAACGAKVLMLRAVEYARNHGVPLHVRSSFSDAEGTRVVNEEESARARDHLRNRARHVGGEGDDPRRAGPARHRGARLPSARRRRRERRHDRAERLGGRAHGHLVHAAEGRRAERRARSSREVAAEVDAAGFTCDPDIAKVSLIGAGMKSHPGVAADMFDALAEAGVNIEIISTSSIRVSCVVRAADVERAVRVVHDRFGLAETPGA